MKQHYNGLTAQEVAESRRLNGSNILTPPVKESLWKRFLQTLTGPFGHLIPGCQNGDMLVFILECAAILSIFISLAEYNGWFRLPVSPDGAKVFFEPAGIIIAIILASGVGFLAEVKAEKEFEVLNQVNDDEPVTVIRDGHATQIPRKDVVVGDIVILTTGEEIPADAELLEATQMSVDESTLTGEPMTYKTADNSTEGTSAKTEDGSPYPHNHVMRGTKILEGHGVARVFAVGDNTENGKVFTATKIDDNKRTPLDEQFDYLGFIITTASCIVGVLVLVGRTLMLVHAMDVWNWPEFIAGFLQSVMIAVTLVVCAVPEGLPMAVTMALAYSMRRMLKTNNLVRKMHACETMGATTVICTDKTGTLTQNKMQVSEIFCVGDDTPYLNMAVNSTAMLDGDNVLGNPTEGALLLWLKSQNIDYLSLREKAEKTAEEPFSTETKYMSTTLADGTRLIKGAPEVVMKMGGNWPAEAEEKLKDWQGRAMRTLAFLTITPAGACGEAIVGIFDPVREDVPEAIQECQNAGIRVIMITGDSHNTAHEIGRQIGLANLDSDIISRAKPLDKKHLVESLQANNEIVAVTGDGTNDAPAMKAANVGLSMGSGTSVAKEASDITIIDNSFSSIVNAVMWGRSLYINIQRFIIFQLTVNITACLVVMIGSFITPEPPLTVTQMLWVNLIMDTFAAIALAALPPSKSVMNYPPRKRRAHIVNRWMAFDIFGTGMYFTVILLVALGMMSPLNMEEKALFFTAFVMMQFWNLFLTRAFKGSYKEKAGKAFWSIAGIIFVGQWFIVTVAYNFFNIAPLPPLKMLTVIAATGGIVFVKYLIKRIGKR